MHTRPHRVVISTWKQMNREISALRGHRLSNMHNDLSFLISVTGSNQWWADDPVAIAGSHRLGCFMKYSSEKKKQ
jgi:hypothetical protein